MSPTWWFRMVAWLACAISGWLIAEYLERRFWPRPREIVLRVVRIRVNLDVPELEQYWEEYVRRRIGELQHSDPKLTEEQRCAIIEREIQEMAG